MPVNLTGSIHHRWNMNRKRVTIQDVAAAAGVSRQTISRVLNDKSDVSDETRQRVQAAMETLNYRPSLAARGLPQRRTYIIGLIIPYSPENFFSDPHLLRFMSGVDQIASRRGYNLLLATNQEGDELSETPGLSAYKRLLQTGYVDGVIVVETLAGQAGKQILKSYACPWITLGYELFRDAAGEVTQPKRRVAPVVHADDRGGARLAMMHLLSLGHQHIGIIRGQERSIMAIDERMAGCEQALADHNLALNPAYIVCGDLTMDSGAAAAQQLLALPVPPTAIFALNDRMAVGAIRHLQARGWRVPEDVSVIGFDDATPIAEMCTPPLTTIRQPSLEMGHQAARLLFELIEDQIAATQPVVLPTELVVRNSTGPVGTTAIGSGH